MRARPSKTSSLHWRGLGSKSSNGRGFCRRGKARTHDINETGGPEMKTRSVLSITLFALFTASVGLAASEEVLTAEEKEAHRAAFLSMVKNMNDTGLRKEIVIQSYIAVEGLIKSEEK